MKKYEKIEIKIFYKNIFDVIVMSAPFVEDDGESFFEDIFSQPADLG